MKLDSDPSKYPFVLEPGFVQLINRLLNDNGSDPCDGIILNFRDSSYSYESGGYHPVELSVDGNGLLLYVTDFSYAGMPPFVELAVELDWSFEHDYFRQFDTSFELVVGQSLFYLWASNFTAYHEMGVYEVEVTPR